MIPPFVPALTLGGFLRYTSMMDSDVRLVETKQPGFTAIQARVAQRRIYANLRKRYQVDQLGQVMGQPSAAGTSPPAISFSGTPLWGDLLIVIAITAGGPVGTAVFSWSKDGGATNTESVLTASTVPLPGTGLTVAFPAGTYSADNVYTASPPIPEEMLQWITDVATPRVYERRGVNPTNDQQMVTMEKRAETALAEVLEAANSKDGLFDLALNADVGGSGITQGSPLVHTETSPYRWQDEQRRRGRREDFHGDDFE